MKVRLLTNITSGCPFIASNISNMFDKWVLVSACDMIYFIPIIRDNKKWESSSVIKAVFNCKRIYSLLILNLKIIHTG